MTKRKSKHDGLHVSRLRPDTDNTREVAFADEWKKEHDDRDLLNVLLNVSCERENCLGLVTERDRIVAATVIQWLGSNIGMCFIGEAFRRCGYRIQWPNEVQKGT